MNLAPKEYFGKINFERSLSNYYISISDHCIEENIPKHNHENPYFSLNLGAAYLEENSRSKYIVEPGKVILRPANYEHKNTFTKKMGLCFNIEIVNVSNHEILRLFKHRSINFRCLEYLQILTKSFHHYSDNELDCLITETILFEHEPRNHFKMPKWYQQVIDKVREDYSKSLTLSDIADSVKLHPNYLARKFKRINGMTLGNYIREVRLEKASLMLYSKKNLTHIALDSGFYDQPHFSRTFRSCFHIPPRRLRSLLLG